MRFSGSGSSDSSSVDRRGSRKGFSRHFQDDSEDSDQSERSSVVSSSQHSSASSKKAKKNNKDAKYDILVCI